MYIYSSETRKAENFCLLSISNSISKALKIRFCFVVYISYNYIYNAWSYSEDENESISNNSTHISLPYLAYFTHVTEVTNVLNYSIAFLASFNFYEAKRVENAVRENFRKANEKFIEPKLESVWSILYSASGIFHEVAATCNFILTPLYYSMFKVVHNYRSWNLHAFNLPVFILSFVLSRNPFEFWHVMFTLAMCLTYKGWLILLYEFKPRPVYHEVEAFHLEKSYVPLFQLACAVAIAGLAIHASLTYVEKNVKRPWIEKMTKNKRNDYTESELRIDNFKA